MAKQTVQVEMVEDSLRRENPTINVISPSATTYVWTLTAAYPFTIDTIDFQTNTGTLDIDVEIDNTGVSWTDAAGTTLSVSSSVDSDTAASANTVAAGETVTLVVSNLASSPAALVATMHITRI